MTQQSLLNHLVSFVLFVAVLILGACSTETIRAEKPAQTLQKPMTQNIPTCRTIEEVRKHYSKVCKVEGTYQTRAFQGKKAGSASSNWQVVILEGGEHVLIESNLDKSKQHEPERAAQLEGKKVEVTGVLNASPPPPPKSRIRANRSVPCISPVQLFEVQSP